MSFRRICAIGFAIAALSFSTGAFAAGTKAASLKVVQCPPTTGKNDFYVGNRAPLLANPLIKLPTGSVRPEGWLRQQLLLEADGFSGRLTELSPWCKFEGSAWASPKGEGANPWEELPYWLKGFTDLGYVLGDKRIIAESNKWIDAILAGQMTNGYFGPQANLENSDIWPNMCVLFAMRSRYEATGDKSMLTAMTKYFRWLNSIPIEKVLPDSWQKTRGGDNLDSIYWLYNRTGDAFLLEVAKKNHDRTENWTDYVASWHGVNFSECFREPAQYYQQSKDSRHLQAAERNFLDCMLTYGQVPGGGFGSDENCRQGYVGPRQGTETCTWAEFMLSDEMLTGISGDPKWADHCEDVAFNSLPASMTPDLKGLHYLTAPNEPLLDGRDKAPGYQNGGNMQVYNPYDFRCCQHNVAMAWPYMNDYLWMATRGNGVAAVLYAPSKLTAKVGGGTDVTIAEDTNYPFDETVTFTVSTSKTVAFPFTMRLSKWCAKPRIAVNGESLALPTDAKGWAVVNRTWKSGDKVTLTLPMDVRVQVWTKNKDCVSVYRGPLAYSVKIGEDWKKSETASKDWPAYSVLPTTPWNYGLVLDPVSPASSFHAMRRKGPVASQPFTPETAPIMLTVKAKKISEWKLDEKGLVQEVAQSPVRSTEPTEEITLIPMGCARLRISAFPQIGEGPDALAWGK